MAYRKTAKDPNGRGKLRQQVCPPNSARSRQGDPTIHAHHIKVYHPRVGGVGGGGQKSRCFAPCGPKILVDVEPRGVVGFQASCLCPMLGWVSNPWILLLLRACATCTRTRRCFPPKSVLLAKIEAQRGARRPLDQNRNPEGCTGSVVGGAPSMTKREGHMWRCARCRNGWGHTANRQPPPTTNLCHLPPATNPNQAQTANHQLFPIIATAHRQLPIATDCQPPPLTNRHGPTDTNNQPLLTTTKHETPSPSC